MSNIAIIPARGGSKRIPRKNIRPFLGKPIIAYSIEAALESLLFDEVMVSTDDEEIAAIAKKYGAKVPFLRSKNMSNDTATLSDVVSEVILQYTSRGFFFDYCCLILATNPLLNIKNLEESLKLILNSSFDSVRPIVKYSYPIQRGLKLIGKNKVEFIDQSMVRIRTQDLKPSYHDAGQFYWMKNETLLKGKNRGGFEIKEVEVQDIDNEDDWLLAEIKYEYLKKNEIL